MPGTDAPLSEDAVPAHIDTTKASIARVYDAALNGKDNYEIDREVLRQVAKVRARGLPAGGGQPGFPDSGNPLHR
jgi:S-adenosyl methyltransferase